MLKTEKGSISQEKRKRLERKFKLESSNTGVDGKRTCSKRFLSNCIKR